MGLLPSDLRGELRQATAHRCTNPRPVHGHWCAGCSSARLFTAEQCASTVLPPVCVICGGTDWRDESEVADPYPPVVTTPGLAPVEVGRGGEPDA